MKLRDILIEIANMNENKALRAFRENQVAPLVQFLSRIGISPNALTFLGLGLGLTAGIFIALNYFLWAVFIFGLSGFADLLDGSLARYAKIENRLGAFYDSVFDRYVDMAVLSGLAWYYANQGEQLALLFVLATFMGTAVTSYSKAKAEALSAANRYVGIMNRPERYALLVIGLLLPQFLPYILGFMAVLTNVTAIHRIVFYSANLQYMPATQDAS